MTDRPILFSAQMVRALLVGRKTQTRRVLPKSHPKFPQHNQIRMDVLTFSPHQPEAWYWDGVHERVGASYPLHFTIGDRLWVREAWRAMDGQDAFSGSQIAEQCIEAGYKRPWSPVRYEADGACVNWISDPHTFGVGVGRYRHARFMPRWASRLTLIVTDVRLQRLQEISGEDCAAEGVCEFALMPPTDADAAEARIVFRDLWNSLHGPEAWSENPWVAAISFRTIHANIDSTEAIA